MIKLFLFLKLANSEDPDGILLKLSGISSGSSLFAKACILQRVNTGGL